MKPIYSFVLSLLSLTFIASCSCGTKMATCPDGRPVSFPKNEKCAKKYYEDAVKTVDINLKATVNVIDQVTVGIDNMGIKDDAKLLKEQLDNESIRLQETLKGSFLALRSDPCGNASNHYKLLESVNNQNYKLQEIKVRFQNSNNTNDLKKTIDDYSRGKEDGKRIGILAGALDRYFSDNGEYPEDLTLLVNENVQQSIQSLGLAIDYNLTSKSNYTLVFEGQDGRLNTSDDKVYDGIDGVTKKR